MEHTEKEFDSLSFHDCYLYGVKWDYKKFSVRLDIDYIIEWIAPLKGEENFNFLVSKAYLVFNNISETKIFLDWENQAPYAVIREMLRTDHRLTPNGLDDWFWTINMSSPEGEISTWATGFDLTFRGKPQLNQGQRIRID